MKRITFIIGVILSIPLIYLIYVYNLHKGWNRTEQFVFALCLIIGFINSVILFYQQKGTNKNL